MNTKILKQQLFLWNLCFTTLVYAQEAYCRYSLLEKIFKQLDEKDISKNECRGWENSNVNLGMRWCKKHLPSCGTNILKTEDLERDGWAMVFRATSANGHSVYHAWTEGTNTSPDKPVSMKRSHGLHYRNSIVTSWSNLGIQVVKFAFYDETKEVAHIIFDGTGSDLTNWFDKSRVIASSWPDLTSTNVYNHFSVAGNVVHNSYDRRFFINRNYGGCPNDRGHVVVINSAVSSPVCLYDSQATYPQFIYSKINSVDLWQRRMFGTADYMAIFINKCYHEQNDLC